MPDCEQARNAQAQMAHFFFARDTLRWKAKFICGRRVCLKELEFNCLTLYVPYRYKKLEVTHTCDRFYFGTDHLGAPRVQLAYAAQT